jgi:quercetin dioxygenase-like cupin family protein
MIVHHLKVAFRDDRGDITDILQHVPVDSVALITCNKGAIRANHYHKDSIQYSFLLSGEMIAYTQMPNMSVESCTLHEGDMLESPPMESHALHAVKDSVLIIVTRGPRGGGKYEDDTFRVPPLHLTKSGS